MNYTKKLALNNFNYMIHRFIRGRGNLENIASEQNEICPSENGYIAASFFFNDELDNIIKYHPETTAEFEMLRIRGGKVRHDATKVWTIKDAYISGNNIYKKNYKRTFPQPNNFIKNESTLSEHESTSPLALTSSYQGVKYFGHWLHDDVVTYLLASQYGLPISFETDIWPDKNTYAKTFEQNWEKYYQGKVSTLFLFQDYAQNSFRTERYLNLRKQIRQKYLAKNPGGNVYIKRGLTGNNIRYLTNEDALITTLKKLNFKILDITEDSLDYIIENLIDARLIITIEGSHQNHALYTLADKGSLIILQPPRMFTNPAKDWCEVLGFKHGITVCKDKGNGFEVNIQTIFNLIEMMKV